ncbi:3,4-dihydroxy-2-butanone-4-phosphate synthase [Azospirillum melinis]|uniref:3,4-dihydroxy-2-butanone 4-phosphate synthase n=1 Tax=Azospirillum melinis TaxID=328839 RepID=A0ABX2KF66_9PROT|nr:3,4-dihydroxy-2-butanone-4-phosphate synthase [Azospirillum melinis]MBP2307587.1 3,4-dihydroxy 2-butanone 4-phosphate synthase/GTP cyclohydrolase II [Azospirillum melinis]NUB00041.1 3,4-dihydroxy-2-butanone-4-phosphate synthase [Azospirillum melinis]
MTMLPCTPRHPFLSSTAEIIEEARNGRMFILVDDEDRENEGDLVIPAQMATPEAINFMASHGRGLICLALGKERIDQLGLRLMSAENGTRHRTAFTVSIEAREGVSTGISAADRARTVAVAIDAARGPDHIVSPGHIFPLVARPGGVLVRAGHTEAAVDVARLAGLNPSGVICEIMKEDGTMARLDDLVAFARRHGLKIGTIRDLIAFRRRHDHGVERVVTTKFDSRWGGEWSAITFRIEAIGTEAIALVKGVIDERPTLVRMHALDILSDVLGQTGDRGDIVARSMQEIAAEGRGVIVLFNRDVALSQLLRVKAGEPYVDKAELRNYGVGAQVLADLGIHDMILLSNSQHVPVALRGYGLNIVEHRMLPVTPAP